MTLSLDILDSSSDDFAEKLDKLLAWEIAGDSAVHSTVREILLQVRTSGDAALIDYTERLDGFVCSSVSELMLSVDDFAASYESLQPKQRDALRFAADRIRDYHRQQLQPDWTFTDALGNRLGQKITPVENVGIYVPGGLAAYPSTVLMTAVPARVAGVDRLVMMVPTPAGERNALVLAAAHVAGVDEGFCAGGAQAIGALAFGTESVAKVDKIVGPGNAYVAAAKREVFGEVGIDLIAGPSEVLIIADDSAAADWLAMDLFSQAEHDPAAQAIIVSPDICHLKRVREAMIRLLPTQQRAETIAQSLNGRGGLIHVRSLEEAVAIANRVAPEHLQLALRQPERLLPAVRHAGAVFLGVASPEVMGDYVAGPSHVLPTFGTARFSSPLGVYDFQKRSSVIQLSETGARSLAPVAELLAAGEGLHAHAESARYRRSED